MRPNAFAYTRPDTVDEALALLVEHGEDAKLLAGGQSLIPLMKLRVVYPAVVVDLNRIPGADGLSVDGEFVRFGALTRHVAVQRSAEIRRALPVVAEAVDELADVQVRNLGTVAGSAAEADPSGDWGPVLLAVGGEFVCRSTTGRRVVPVDGFFVDYLTSDLDHTEMIEEIRLRRPPARGAGSAYRKLERRVGDFAVVSTAVALTLDDDGRCTSVGVGVGGVGLTPYKAKSAEDLLRGTVVDQAALDEATELVRSEISPIDDGRGPAWYKRDTAGVFFQRTMAAALERARASLTGGNPS